MADAAPSSRKPRPKVRALKDHEPLFHLDIEKAEGLMREMSAMEREEYRIFSEFVDLIRWPLARAAGTGTTEAEAKDMLESLERVMSDFLMGMVKQRDEARHLMAAAVAAMRLYRTRQMKADGLPQA